MKKILTIGERSDFLFNVAQTILNTQGFLDICVHFWGTMDSWRYMTHDFLDQIELEIYRKSQLLEYQQPTDFLDHGKSEE